MIIMMKRNWNFIHGKRATHILTIIIFLSYSCMVNGLLSITGLTEEVEVN